MQGLSLILFGVCKAVDRLKDIVVCKSADEAKQASNDALKIVDFDQKSLSNYSEIENLAIIVQNMKEFLFVANTNVSYAVVREDMAKKIQECANEYMMDIKVLAQIKDDEELEKIALLGIDGVIILP